MEDTERPQKVRKLEHAAKDTTGNGAAQTAGEGESLSNGAQREVESPPSQDGTTIGLDDKEDDAAAAGDPTTTSTTGNDNEGSAAPPLSKNQLKKLRRQEKWEAGRELRKIKRKQKLTERRARKRAEKKEGVQSSTGSAENGASEASRKPTAGRAPPRTLLPLTFVLDCSYDDLMLDNERKSLAAQLTRSYSDNSRYPYGAHFMISSFNGLLKERFDQVLRKTHERWKGVKIMEEDYMAAVELAKGEMSGPGGGEMSGAFAGKESTDAEAEGEVVYLTSDSPNTLTELKPYSTYIIGGLVDKNRHKGVCYKSAMNNGLKTAKLPIGEYMKMNSRFVLATNHVVEIMLKWLQLGDWGEAFMQVMPKRKGGELKEKEGQATPEQEAEEPEEPDEGEGAVNGDAPEGDASDKEPDSPDKALDTATN